MEVLAISSGTVGNHWVPKNFVRGVGRESVESSDLGKTIRRLQPRCEPLQAPVNNGGWFFFFFFITLKPRVE